MKINYYITIFMILIFSLTSSNTNDITNELPLSKMDILEVSYDTSNEQKYDIYLPEGRNLSTAKVILLVHSGGWIGAKNPLIPISQGIEMQQKLEDLGVINEFTLFANEGHIWEGENLFNTATKITAFIESHL